MNDQFLNVCHTEITFDYRGDTYKVFASHGHLSVKEFYTHNESSELSENELEYWIGALVYWYEQSWNNPWTENDYRCAAHVCRIKGHILEPKDLERICGITESMGSGPSTTREAERALKSFDYSVNPLAEGAD